ncbi:MAG: lytic transglycosylase F [Desulfobacterales bacterium]|nr:lytic transglycosylase F [Desulfobacterales bacterium]
MKSKAVVMIIAAVAPILSLILSGQTLADELPDKARDTSFKTNVAWKGDFENLVERRFIRLLIPYSKTYYFLDKATQRGASYELVKAFEKQINKELKTRHLKIHALFLPTARDQLIPDLAAGLGDLAVGNLTITPERAKLVDFSDPFSTGVSEILVTGPKSPGVKKSSDLAGRTVHLRKSSSYYESVRGFNRKLKAEGKKEMRIVPADENLEDEDLLEMLNAGLISMIVIDSHKGEFWAQIFDRIQLHPEIRFRENASIAWAVQKGAPEFRKRINTFAKGNKRGTLMGNMIFERYLKSTKYVRNSLGDKERQRFKDTVAYFRKYAGMYNFNWLMLAAMAYQESGIDQTKRSPSGAIGVMQVLPSTARDKNVDIPDIEKIGPNIHAGTKYLRFMADRYFSDPGIDPGNQMLLSFAAYNAGPARVADLREEAVTLNLNPNIWFKHVEVVAARRIGRETVQYVSNIFKYYVAYRMIAEHRGLEGDPSN